MLEGLLLPVLLALPLGAAPGHPPGPTPADQGEAPPARDGGAGLEEVPALPEPGSLPADASPRARELWGSLVAKNLAQEPIQAFDLSFYVRHRSQDGRQSNDFESRYRFLLPGFVRVSLESGREHLRGPKGDYLIDRGEVQSLVGRGNVEDRRQIDETVAIARNFLSLTDPTRLRIVRLSAPGAPPFALPEGLREAARGLDWLEVTSPDFHLARRGSPPPTAGRNPGAPALFRAVLGLDPGEHRIELAIIHEEVAGALALGPSTMLVDLGRHTRLDDGYLVPRVVRIHGVDLERSPWAFHERFSSELTLKPDSVGLRPPLTPEQFLP